jgi:hypothetical protein
MAQEFHCRPSDIYRLEHPVLAHDFDTAVWLFGTNLDNDIAEAQSKVKKPEQREAVRKLRLSVWLGEDSGYAQPTPGKRKAW